MNLVLFAILSLTPIFLREYVIFDNWIKNEAIPSGTQTTFSDTRPTYIIMHFFISFNPKTVHLYNITEYKGTSPFQNNKNEQGNFVLTTIPIKRNKKFINAINKGNLFMIAVREL